MSDFATALERIRNHGGGILADAAETLRQLVRDTCDAISASEGSILVPSEDETELRFLVSMNPDLEAGVKVPVAESISGYVFSSRQAMAKINPDSLGASQVDKIAQLTTKYLLAVPIIDDDRVYGVATFVNRAEGVTGPFTVQELKMAQGFGEIYATGMKLYRKIEFSVSVAELEVAEHARELGVGELPGSAEACAVAAKYRLPAILAEKSVSLPEREREMLDRVADLLAEYAQPEEELYDL